MQQTQDTGELSNDYADLLSSFADSEDDPDMCKGLKPIDVVNGAGVDDSFEYDTLVIDGEKGAIMFELNSTCRTLLYFL